MCLTLAQCKGRGHMPLHKLPGRVEGVHLKYQYRHGTLYKLHMTQSVIPLLSNYDTTKKPTN